MNQRCTPVVKENENAVPSFNDDLPQIDGDYKPIDVEENDKNASDEAW